MKNGFLTSCFLLFLNFLPVPGHPQNPLHSLSDILRNVDFQDILTERKIAVIDSCHGLAVKLRADSLIALGYHMRGVVYSNNEESEFSKTVQPFIKAFRLRKTLAGVSDIDLAKSGYWAGYHAYRIRELDTSKMYLQAVIDLPIENEFTIRSLKQLGIVESELGNFDRAAILLQQALEKSDYLDAEQSFNLYLNQSFIQLGEKSRESLLTITRTKEDVFEKFGEAIRAGTIEYFNLARYYKNIALAYDLLENYQKSIEYNLLGIDIIMKNICCVEDLIDKAGLLNNLGNVYRKTGRLKDAESAYQESLDTYKKYNVVPGIAEIYDNLGELNLRRKDFSRAIAFYDSSYFLLMGEFPGPDHKTFRTASNKQKVLTVLRDKADGLRQWYQINSDVTTLNKSLLHYSLADKMIDAIRFSFPDESAHLHWREDAKEVYERSVPAALLADSLHLAFQYMERGKALVLSEALRKSRATRLIPDSTSKRIRKNQQILDEIEKKIFQFRTSEHPDPEKIQILTDSLLRSQAYFESFMDSIHRHFPDYFEVTHQNLLHSVSDIQQSIQPDQVILSYFLTTDTVLCAKLTRNQLNIRNLGSRVYLDSLLNKQLWLINQFDSAYSLPVDSFNKYKSELAETSFKLYELLIKPWDPMPEKIIIIPDENIALINFETLLKEIPYAGDPFRNFNFLIKHHIFSQSPSVHLWFELSRRHTNTTKAISLAPGFENSPYPTLGFEKKSIEHLSKHYSLQKYTGYRASRAPLEQIKDQAIIHFYTHAVIDENDSEYSYVLLNKKDSGLDSFYLKDIYHLQIPNSLIVISACETHLGDVAKGEGIISLSRAFTYAGASCLITSLWPVATEPSSWILNEFYRSLSKGKTKDEALREAKLAFLESAPERKLEHPYIWGNFILIGNPDPIPGIKFQLVVLYPALAAWLILLGWVIYRYRSKSKMTPKPR